MPAKATVLVGALPCMYRFRGHGPPHKDRVDGPRIVGAAHARESDGSGCGASLNRPRSGAWPGIALSYKGMASS